MNAPLPTDGSHQPRGDVAAREFYLNGVATNV